jgi:ring-1,2-phenylacetyl-CoA epoxidase subunit PaaC
MADDELVLAHRDSEWCGHAPILEEDIAFANIAQDELGHARLWYECVQQLDGTEPDRLVFFRDAAAWRNVRMVELPRGDWAFSMVRQYLFDAFEMARLERLLESAYEPLAQAAAKVMQEEQYHLRHTCSWMRRLGLGTEESNQRTQQALEQLWPLAWQLFRPLPQEALLVEAGYVPDPAQLAAEWEEAVRPFLHETGLQPPDNPDGEPDGREVHTPHLQQLLDELQEVARLDAEAEW